MLLAFKYILRISVSQENSKEGFMSLYISTFVYLKEAIKNLLRYMEFLKIYLQPSYYINYSFFDSLMFIMHGLNVPVGGHSCYIDILYMVYFMIYFVFIVINIFSGKIS